MRERRFRQIMAESDARWKAAVRESNEHAERLMMRAERSERHFIEALAENTARLEKLDEGWEEAREEIRAGTRAILSVLDRLDGLEGGTA